MATGKEDLRKLARSAAGRPPELSISLIQGNDTAWVAVPGSKTGDLLVSVLHVNATGGSAWVDRTSTSELRDGSLSPGADVNNGQLIVYWYKFHG